jgi:hypothetical protein
MTKLQPTGYGLHELSGDSIFVYSENYLLFLIALSIHWTKQLNKFTLHDLTCRRNTWSCLFESYLVSRDTSSPQMKCPFVAVIC